MPALNSIKQYVEGGYYHIYNRGIEKRKIFKCNKDYSVFLRYLKEYLLPPNHPKLLILQGTVPRRKAVNCYSDIELLSYCLMPNHFHLFVRQKTKYGLKIFSKALLTNYVMYFNHRYEREGPLFQGRYKAVLLTSEAHYIHISRYIHRNPLELLARDCPLHNYKYSSYKYYVNEKAPDWINTKPVLSMFSETNSLFNNKFTSYQYFVESYNCNDRKKLGRNTLD